MKKVQVENYKKLKTQIKKTKFDKVSKKFWKNKILDELINS